MYMIIYLYYNLILAFHDVGENFSIIHNLWDKMSLENVESKSEPKMIVKRRARQGKC